MKVDGAKLSAARVAAEMPMRVVAETLSCSKRQVHCWETGKLNPSEERVKAMVKLFGTDDFVVKETGK